jgi:hypothetical protein
MNSGRLKPRLKLVKETRKPLHVRYAEVLRLRQAVVETASMKLRQNDRRTGR